MDDGMVAAKPITKGMSAVTVTMWVKGEYKIGNLLRGPVIIHFQNDMGFYLSGQDGKGSGYLDWDRNIADSQNWRHLAAVWSSPGVGDGKMKLYIDGIKQKNELAYAGGTGGLAGGYLCLAGRFNHRIGAFRGELEDVRIYDRALTDEEVFDVYRGNGFDVVTNGLAVWYPLKDKDAELMIENNGFAIRDKSGNGRHGEIKGAPVWKNDDAAAQKRSAQIGIACENLGRKKAKCETLRQSLTKWFEEHPSGHMKWRARFDELNKKNSATFREIGMLRDYNELHAEIGLAELYETK
ncbi:MAG: LamG domain-containing protein [Kiritimatiellae bacterium]|nr:LamG domain-containing protein [Kiritimatiellia bacterium]